MRTCRAVSPLLQVYWLGWFWFCVSVSAAEDPAVCLAGEADPNPACPTSTVTANGIPIETVVGSLLPHQLPPPVVFSDFASNFSVTLENGVEVEVATGSVRQINQAVAGTASATKFSVLPHALNRSSVQNVLEILQAFQHFDDDPDTVDGMPTYEIFMDSPDLYKPSNKFRDSDPNFVPDREKMREKIQAILKPYLETTITPYVQQHTDACKGKTSNRACTPCYSLIRRYRHGDRVSHATHHDGHAIVTVVVSLSDYNTDYRGGLYVGTGFGQREFLALNKGDAVVHQSTLLHGVQVYDIEDTPESTHRWSWIMWYKDSTDCQDYSYEWFADCAQQGDAICQTLHSTKVGAIPDITEHEAAKIILELNQEAAEGGSGTAAVKIARAYLHRLPSSLPLDVNKAMHYYQLAIESHNPDGHYGMADILLQIASGEQQQQRINNYNTNPRVVQAVQHLEAAAKLHHSYAQFNLGMVHTFGYATNAVNGTVAAMWFEQSGLPEGYFLAAQQAKAVGDQERYQSLGERAQALGFMAPWRAQARQATGSGGAGGVSLNLPWPVAADGRKPPQL